MNQSKFRPVDTKVLILPAPVEVTTASGIVLHTDANKEREEMARVEGILIAVGGNAFMEWGGDVPKIGDRVVYCKYAGVFHVGKDGVTYRLCQDEDIVGIIEE